MAKQPQVIAEQPVHTHLDAVTGELVREVRDDVWHAAYRAGAAVERACLAVPTTAVAHGRLYAMARAAAVYLAGLEAVTYPPEPEGRKDPAPLEGIRAEWARLDMPGRTRFAGLLRAKLSAMVPHTGGYGVGPKVKPNTEAE